MAFPVEGPQGERVRVSGHVDKGGIITFSLGDFLAPCVEDPYFTTTYGVGELLVESIVFGAQGVVLELPGKFPYDGGIGLLSALGVRFFDARGRELTGIGDSLRYVASLDISSFLKKPKHFRVVLALGKEEGPPIRGLHHFARILARFTGEYPLDFRDVSGIGMALGVFWNIVTCERREVCA